MGLFGKGGETTSQQRGGTTVIAEGSRLHGELNLEGKLHIDGRIEGTIRCRGDVAVGRRGYFEGQISAVRLLVSGHVEGRVECEALEIVEGGRVHGDVSTEHFVIEPGGQFAGNSIPQSDGVISSSGRIADIEAGDTPDPEITVSGPAEEATVFSPRHVG